MEKKHFILCALLLCCCTTNFARKTKAKVGIGAAGAQKALVTQSASQNDSYKKEINAFEKQNKELLKSLKKEYGAKVEVQYHAVSGGFYLKVQPKKSDSYWLLGETGEKLYPSMLTGHTDIANYLYACGESSEGVGGKWGVISLDGKVIVPMEYVNIYHKTGEEATNISDAKENEVWHPAYTTTFLGLEIMGGYGRNVFYSESGEVLCEHYGQITFVNDYIQIKANEKAHSTGLLTRDGKVLLDPVYDRVMPLSLSGYVCYAKFDGFCNHWGAKSIKGGDASSDVPMEFTNIKWNQEKSVIEVKQHRDEEWCEYNPDSTYKLSFKDDGERYYDAGNYDEVLKYYEGVGFDAVWGKYYMGMSAMHLANKEYEKMQTCIKLFKDSEKYYYPIEYPKQYDFNSGNMARMFLASQTYFEQFLRDTTIVDSDPMKVQARLKRGEVATNNLNISKLVEEYTLAHTEAVTKNVQRKAALAQQEALRQAQAKAQADAVSNAIGGLLKGLIK